MQVEGELHQLKLSDSSIWEGPFCASLGTWVWPHKVEEDQYHKDQKINAMASSAERKERREEAMAEAEQQKSSNSGHKRDLIFENEKSLLHSQKCDGRASIHGLGVSGGMQKRDQLGKALRKTIAPNISKLVKKLCKTRETETGGFQGWPAPRHNWVIESQVQWDTLTHTEAKSNPRGTRH